MSDLPLAVVTGGAGFIGSHMVDLLLDEGCRVLVIDNLTGGRRENLAHRAGNPNLTVQFRDVLDLDPAKNPFAGAKYVFHFAGIGDIVPSIQEPAKYMRHNVLGTVNALECARSAGVEKFVYAASSSCYGLAEELPTTEHALIEPLYPYALSKYQGEQAVHHWGKVYKLPVMSVRIFNAYGPRVKTTGAYGAVFGVFFAQKLAGKPLTIVGDGTQTRDFVYVTDVARAFLAAARCKLTGEIFNVGGGNPQSVNRLVELIGGRETIHVPKRPGEPDCTWADIRKIQAETGWKPLVSFEQGVAAMLEHIEEWRDAPVWDKDSIARATKTWFDFMSAA